MRDQITQDVAAAAGKVSLPVVGTITTLAQGIQWADWVAISTITYTVVLTATTVMRNWGDWTAWLAARVAAARRFWGWVRGR
ncbi:hypothetical protein G3I15_24945 [Streptomyces sp. SID10244]|nr:hypothetical protein [Streptomyces sp. SID10244]